MRNLHKIQGEISLDLQFLARQWYEVYKAPYGMPLRLNKGILEYLDNYPPGKTWKIFPKEHQDYWINDGKRGDEYLPPYTPNMIQIV